ncbi:hypothetical protein BpHYR1_040373 [Brachionus plicatilis]|uniref:Uncharacterized protein n=1 Tax=Brachionus plicatilis TaxID=10195 RepID=A0A3M7Q2V1_BRAPC|nr:hypothetical protein BpHYR1_040373 [Brachionus plicatilis]
MRGMMEREREREAAKCLTRFGAKIRPRAAWRKYWKKKEKKAKSGVTEHVCSPNSAVSLGGLASSSGQQCFALFGRHIRDQLSVSRRPCPLHLSAPNLLHIIIIIYFLIFFSYN